MCQKVMASTLQTQSSHESGKPREGGQRLFSPCPFGGVSCMLSLSCQSESWASAESVTEDVGD